MARKTLVPRNGPRLTAMDLVTVALILIAVWRLVWPRLHPGTFPRLVSAHPVSMTLHLPPMVCGLTRQFQSGQTVQNTLLLTTVGTVQGWSSRPVVVQTPQGPRASAAFCYVDVRVQGAGQVYPDAVVLGGQRLHIGTFLPVSIGPWQGTGIIFRLNGKG